MLDLNRVHQGSCLDLMPLIPDASVDSCVTDPPYGLSFMGKKWDYDVPSIEIWKEVFRVLKPGAHLLAFSGSRTYHRMVVNIEDAGFEIRDQIMWIYGSGFPKSLDVSKAIDKEAGAEREKIVNPLANKQTASINTTDYGDYNAVNFISPNAATDDAKQWDGWGTALKPAHEPIVVARRPLSEKTVAANVLKWGTGGINIDGCRIELDEQAKSRVGKAKQRTNKKSDIHHKYSDEKRSTLNSPIDTFKSKGRWPANVIIGDDETAAMLDEQSGVRKSGGHITDHERNKTNINFADHCIEWGGFQDSGGASRFFYCAKASKAERDTDNNHPTVKPIDLMRYLVRLVTPPDGIVIDPFAGSASTLIAAYHEAFNFIGIELSEEYCAIARTRIERETRQGRLL